MSTNRIAKRLFAIILSVCMIVSMCPFMADLWNDSGHVDADSAVDQFVSHAIKHADDKVDKNYNLDGCSGKRKFNTEWCAIFVAHCAEKAGFKSLPYDDSAAVDSYAIAVVNKFEGKITFVKESSYNAYKKSFNSSRCEYNPNYKPKKGDLVTFSTPQGPNFGHIGIVAADATKKAPKTIATVEGNTRDPNSKSFTIKTSKVSYYKDRSTSTVTTYITPKGVTSTLDTSQKTDAKNGIVYKLTGASNIYKEASTSSKVLAKNVPAGTSIDLLGKITSPSGWYKIKFLNKGTKTTGYVKGNVGRLTNGGNGKVTVTNVGSFTIAAGKGHDVTYRITSVYPIYSIQAIYTKTGENNSTTSPKATSATSLYYSAGSPWEDLKAANNNTKKLTAGEYSLTVVAKDVFGNTGKGYATINVTGSIKKPTIIDSADTEDRRTVKITQNSSGTLYYKVGNADYQSTTATSKTIPVITAGKTAIIAYTKGKSKGDCSLPARADIYLNQLKAPEINTEQLGREGLISIKADNGATVYYVIDGGAKQTYNGPFKVSGESTITAYAAKKGFLRSDPVSFTTEYTEPDTPSLKLMNSDSTIAVGESVTVSWNKDWKALQYKATLFKENEESKDSVVSSVETDTPSVSFVLSEAGKYYVIVTASNDLGDSGDSNQIEVAARNPSTVVFRDADILDIESGKIIEGKELLRLSIKYGEKLEKVETPSHKGYTFTGWKNEETGELSSNLYLNKAVKEDTNYTATYEKKKYKVRIYDHNGIFIMTSEVKYGDDVTADENVNNKLTQEGYLNEGKQIKGWTVIDVDDEESKADIHAIDANMQVQVVCAWANENLPVIIRFTGDVKSTYDEDGDVVVKPPVKITTNENRKTQIYLIATIKGIDEDTGAEKALYMDRRIFSIPKGETGLVLNANADSHDFDLPIEAKDANSIAKIELVAVEKKQNGTTGSAYSEIAQASIIRECGFTVPSEWSTKKPVDVEGRKITSKVQYRYRDKEIVYSGEESLSGYTKEKSELMGTSYTNWYKGTGSNDVKRYSQYKEVITAENVQAYKSFCKICNCGKWSAETKSGKCTYCGSKTITDHKLKVFSSTKLTGSKEKSGNGEGGYIFGKTVTVGNYYYGIGTVYMITYGHNNIQNLDTFTSKNAKGKLFLWQDDNGASQPLYRLKTEKIRNVFYKYSDWSNEQNLDPDSEKAWSDTPIQATAIREIDTRILYQYQDEIPTPELNRKMSGEVQIVEGNLDSIEDDFNNKIGTVMVYQANNNDPNQYQMQYTGQISFKTDMGDKKIGKNHYSFKFIPKNDIDNATGNYIVSIGVEGTTGLVTVGVIKSAKEDHSVTIYYRKDENDPDSQKTIIAEQNVKEGKDVDLSSVEIPERKGYYFAGFDKSTTNINEDCSIRAVYLPMQCSVAFVDWVNQTIDLRTKETGKSIELPVITNNEDDEAYKFIGWKREDGSIITEDEITVEGNMIITAEYETATFTVRFLDIDDNTIDTQQVAYHQRANPPAYMGNTYGGTFASWSTLTNWWSVEEDVDVRPVIVYSETLRTPTATIEENEDTSVRTLVITEPEDEESNCRIFITVNGEEPKAELIQEYISGGTDTGIIEYTGGLSFKEDTQVIAVAYSKLKNVSEPMNYYYEVNPEPVENEIVSAEEWEIINSVEIKAEAGKDVEISLSLDNNPGILGYDVLVMGDDEVFYSDVDQYNDPVVDSLGAYRSGKTLTRISEAGWQTTWYGNSSVAEAGTLFRMTLHVSEDAKSGIYPITVCYAPDNTYNDEYEGISLRNAAVSVLSQASIPINTLDISLNRTSFVYEGEPIEATVIIEGLKEGEDYTVDYDNNINVGTAKAIITGIGSYIGTAEKEFTITQANIANADVEAIPAQEKTGSPVEPELNVTFNGKALEKGKDYNTEYTDNTDAGTATVTLKGIGNFKGSNSVEFEIIDSLEAQLAEVRKELEESENARREAEASVLELTDEKAAAEQRASELQTQYDNASADVTRLTQEKAELEEDAVANAARIAEIESELATANTAKTQAETALNAANAEKTRLEGELAAAQAAKAAAESTLAAVRAEKERLEGELAAANTAKTEAEKRAEDAEKAKQAAENKVTELTEAKETAEQNLADLQVEYDKADAEVTKLTQEKAELEKDAVANAARIAEIEGELATANAAKAKAESDLNAANAEKTRLEGELAAANAAKAEAEKRAEEAEKALAEAQQGGGSTRIDLTDAEIKGVANFVWTGDEITQAMIVKLDGKSLAGGVDYTVVYENNVAVGKAVMKIRGIGNYTGTIIKSFSINPKETKITGLTKAKKAFTAKWKKQTNQTTGYQIQYGLKKDFKGAKTVTVSNNTTASRAIKKLKSKKTYYVRIRTYKDVNGTRYVSKWSATKSVKTK